MQPAAVRALIKRAIDFKPESGPGADAKALPKIQPAPSAPPLAVSGKPGALPTTTPRAQLGGWYANAGGFDKAVTSAQNAIQHRTPGILNPNTWTTWNQNRLDTKIPVDMSGRDITSPTTRGQYSYDAGGQISIRPDLTPQNSAAVLRHEATHGLLLPDLGTRQTSRVAAGLDPAPAPTPTAPPQPTTRNTAMAPAPTIAQQAFRGVAGLASGAAGIAGGAASLATAPVRMAVSAVYPGKQTQPAQPTPRVDSTWSVPDLAQQAAPTNSEDAEYNKYLLNPAETDVRLAEIKRQYAHQTGTLVETPEQAQDAWKWYQQNQDKLSPDMTLEPEQFELYDSLPEEQKTQLFHRMPELVQNTQGQYKYSAQLTPYHFAQKLANALGDAYDLAEIQTTPTLRPTKKKKPQESVNYMPYLLSGLAAGLPAVILAGKFMRAANNQYQEAKADARTQALNAPDALTNAQRFAQQKAREYRDNHQPRFQLQRK